MVRKRANLRTWIATATGTVGVCVGIALGCWQLDRAAQKNSLQQAILVQAASAPLDGQAVRDQIAQNGESAVEWLRHRPVQLQGHWLPQYTVYLDNRQMQARPGFFVLTPLQLTEGGVVLVQRGWIARNFQQRLVLPPVETPTGRVVLEGQLAGSPGRLYALGEDAKGAHTQPDIRQNVDLASLAQATGLPLWPVTVVQTGAASEGLLRDWPQPGSGVATHYGYAFQWFSIAAVLAAMLLWFQLIQPARAARKHHAF